MARESGKKQKTAVFFHPDLGIGGAERLVVDAAVGLQDRGYKVVIFTSHCDPKHCFDEARDGTLDVRVRGNSLVPASIVSRLTILCAILRQLHLILQIYVTSELRALDPDVFFFDQLSAGMPLLQYLDPAVPTLFYCHFPDLYLAQGRQTWWKRTYRVPFDKLEEWSMGFAAEVAVNSEFTKGVAASAWPALAAKRDFRVVYPCIDITGPAEPAAATKTTARKTASAAQSNSADNNEPANAVWEDDNIILSINRFERKKDIALAIRAFAAIPEAQRKEVRLVVAGGYDLRSAENYQCHRELADLARSLGLESFTAKNIITALSAPREVPVLFLLSIPAALKASLLRSARLLVYTPSNEHFGIVPLEAMLAGVPVLATNTGGPKETVVEGETGWLRDPGAVEQWATVIDGVLNETGDEELARMGRAGVERVRGGFGQTKMAETLDGILGGMRPVGVGALRTVVFLVSFLLAGTLSAIVYRWVR